MEASNLSPLLLFFFYFSLLQTSTIATKKSYIVYLGSEHSSSLDPSSLSEHSQQVTALHYDLLGSSLGSKTMAEEAIFYSYTRSFNGFAAILDDKEAENLARNPKVISVFENKARKLHTTRSWNFLGVENDIGIPSNSIWNAAKFGEDVIIANIDTGVWPESKSFSDEGYGPVPSKWRGICQTDSNFLCNRKLIGGRYFHKGYEAAGGKLNATLLTVRDHDGHGTHTLSTAAGNFVTGANVFGHGNGTAKGGAPKARAVAYKVCWPPLFDSQCFDADILAAFEAAIADGVDVLSTSLGGAADEYFNDPLAIAAFLAVQRGILVVFSGGNSGPFPMTVTNVSPWVFTVAANTIDRDFVSYVGLGNKKHIKVHVYTHLLGLGASRFAPNFICAPELYNQYSIGSTLETSNQFCGKGTLDPMKVKGKIVICQVGETEGVDKGYQASLAGAAGVIVANDIEKGDEIYPELHFIPASDITNTDAQIVQKYLKSTKTPIAHLTSVKTLLSVKPAPIIATFSSRGPNPIDSTILKPDVTAPGVNILASYPTGIAPTFSAADRRRIPFNVISGTSMSCPHVAGIAGLVKSIHPNWSPAAIKSAIMTTAKTRGNNNQTILDSTKLKATPYAYGAGQVYPNDAADPGLVYDITINDYLNFLCARGYDAMKIKKFYAKPFNCVRSFKVTDLNYPSISVGELKIGAPLTINRRVKNVGSPGTYVARVKASPGVAVTIEPSTLVFRSVGEEKGFKVVLQNTGKVKSGDVFGTLIWSDGKHFVRSPIAVHLGPGIGN
ncbi:subtilisin-like protease SBT5.3 [Cucumis melo var. makuwa]|uniref:Subtilisin-like protease SBT5.3 n=1 Tax=Cucumis melo var. makuwa TaxID=1194695 RepID=A0A5D3D763_CUCMM|nr:subtilisin-like protease SBT5.3 [Cucumis melo var. makuwa]